jgi:hypothetical protein
MSLAFLRNWPTTKGKYNLMYQEKSMGCYVQHHVEVVKCYLPTNKKNNRLKWRKELLPMPETDL